MHVIIKLNNGEEVMGKFSVVDEKSIMLSGALIIRYGMTYDGVPTVYFEKYSLFTVGFDVVFMNSRIDHVFKDPMKGIIHYYEDTIEKMRMKYTALAKKKKMHFKSAEENDFKDLDETAEYIMDYNSKKVH